MIELLVSDALELESSPLRPSLVFDHITFENGKLWQPRYGSLIDYSRVPGLQPELGIQIRTKNPLDLELTFEIEADQGVTFVQEDVGEEVRVKCRSIDNLWNAEVPGLVEARWESGTRCTLVWRQSHANDEIVRQFQNQDRRKEITALRIFCQAESEPDAWDLVEGGLYVAILFNPRDNAPLLPGFQPERPILPPPPPGEVADRPQIRIVNIDEWGRPAYDLFRLPLENVPPVLEWEPTFRVREGESVDLDLILDLPALPELQWKTLRGGGEAEVTPFSAEGRPRQLHVAETLVGERGCRVRWLQHTGRAEVCRTGTPDATRCYCTTGYVSSFLFTAAAPGPRLEDLRNRLPVHLRKDPNGLFARVAIDPTVIEPPACTPDGVCIPPGGPRGS